MDSNKLAKNKTKIAKLDKGFDSLISEKKRRAQAALGGKLRRDLDNTDTQRLMGIFWGDNIYKSIFDEKGRIRRKGKMDKKGSVFDNLYIFLWFFIAAVVFVVIILMWNNFNAGYTASSATGQSVLDIFENDIKPQYDFMVFGMYMAAMVITFILAYLIKMHRIFIVVSFVFTVATFLVSSVLSNVYGEFIAQATLAGGAASFPITNFVIDKFPVFYIIFALLLIFVMAVSEELG